MTARTYIRVSTGLQAEKGFSLDAQREKALAWCRYEGLTDYKLYPDAGISGRLDDRPALNSLLRDLKSGDTVIVYSLSRLGRGGAVQMLGIIQQIRERGARLVSLTEHIDTETSAGRLMLTILAALAELEVEQTRERTEAGRLEAARQGIYPHSSESLPTGWKRDEEGRIVEDEHASTVRLIFAQGQQQYERTAKMLIQNGIPAPKGGKWEVVQVRRIIQYAGYWRGFLEYRSTVLPDDPSAWIRIPAPALVTQEEWQAAQRDARKNHRHKRPEKFPLSGHLLCQCGAKLMGRDQSTGPAVKPNHNRKKGYCCYERVRKTPLCPSNDKSSRTWYTSESIEADARKVLAAYLSNPTDPANLHVLTGGPSPTDPHESERADIERRLTALTRMQLDQAIEYNDYLKLRTELIAQRDALPIPLHAPTPEMPELQHLAQTIRTCPPEEFAELLDILNVTFQMTKAGNVKLVSLTPFSS